ncbi:MAG: hypothetical protein J07HX64_02332 [halophilic archaeon J07HX64]|jgi:hypothetical protein|nr:MAG: hypothetical protein J07HX64_02332 [halophilic archaeon J07HX64]
MTESDPDASRIMDRVVNGRHLAGVAVLALVVALMGVAAVGAVTAQEGEPAEPVNIYGSAADELGNSVNNGTTIYAVVDGEEEDNLTAGPDGQFGGAGAFDDKLAVNGSTEVVFTVESPNGTEALNTTELGSADPVVEVNLTFPVATFAEIDATGDGEFATDTTGNGLLNDVNGDGEFTIFDVQAFFLNFETPAVQNNPEAFNFDGDENDQVTIFDVQELFLRLTLT